MPRDAPDEVLRPTKDEDYLEYREQTDMREPYRCGGAWGHAAQLRLLQLRHAAAVRQRAV